MVIVHLIYRYDIGGLEKVMTATINGLPDHYQHIVISLTTISDEISAELNREVRLIALNKKGGHDLGIYWKIYRLLREIKPDILQSYNLPTIEYQFIAWLAGIKKRIHAEHGRDASDPEGKSKKYNRLRRWMRPFINHWIGVSADLQQWLDREIGVAPAKNHLITNGIDTKQFHPPEQKGRDLRLEGFASRDNIVIGTIGRLDPVKDQAALISALAHIRQQNPEMGQRIIIAIIGHGPLHEQLRLKIADLKLEQQVWLPGPRYDISRQLQDFDIFALPSIAEGIPITLLEAMATGLPVIASRVGGIPEVVIEETGTLIPAQAPERLTEAIVRYMQSDTLREQHGTAAREQVIKHYSQIEMIKKYLTIYA